MMDEVDCVLRIIRRKALCFRFTGEELDAFDWHISEFFIMMFKPEISYPFGGKCFKFKTTAEVKNSLRFIIQMLEESSHYCLKITLE